MNDPLYVRPGCNTERVGERHANNVRVCVEEDDKRQCVPDQTHNLQHVGYNG